MHGTMGCKTIPKGVPSRLAWLCAVEAAALREELAALREAAGCDEADILQEELAGLRAELLRLADENRRLQSTPKARPCMSCLGRVLAKLPHIRPHKTSPDAAGTLQAFERMAA